MDIQERIRHANEIEAQLNRWRVEKEIEDLQFGLRKSQEMCRALAGALTQWLTFGSHITGVDSVVPRKGDEAKLLEISTSLLAQANELYGAMLERCRNLDGGEGFQPDQTKTTP